MKLSYGHTTKRIAKFPQKVDELKLYLDKVALLESVSPEYKVDGNRDERSVHWDDMMCYYVDSEGDLNVISEDEDLEEAHAYMQAKSMKMLRVELKDKEIFE